jgi:polysaccharide export outer membrane protein
MDTPARFVGRTLRLLCFAPLLVNLVLCGIGSAQEKGTTSAVPRDAAHQTGSPTNDTVLTVNTTAPNEKKDANLELSSSTRVGPGDLLEVAAYDVPEFSTKTRVGSDGDVYLPLIDYVHVADLSIEEAQQVIEKRLSGGGFIKDPHVTIFVDESASQGANILGEVAKPGTYPVLGHQHLLDVISAAGGLTDKAGSNAVVTHREEPDKPVSIALGADLANDPDKNIEIFPGDTILVRKADVVYIMGEVQRPSGLLMNGGNLTVLQAIALTGGTTRTAKLNGVRLIRKNGTGVTETSVQLKKILQAKVPDVPMRADDILFVPSSATKTLTSRGVDTMIQTASALTLVAARP